jgi:hypothetical protein
MPRVDPELFATEEVVRVFVAFKLAEARLAEALLDERGVEYVVVVEPIGRTLFGSPRNGAVFSVQVAKADDCRTILRHGGLAAGVLSEPPRVAADQAE